MRIARILSGRRRMVLAGVAAIAFAAAAPVALSAIADRADAAVEMAPGEGGGENGGVLADLEGRSPGARLAAIATKSVKAAARALGVGPDDTEEPEQRALGKVFDAPPTEDVLLGLGAPPAGAFPDGVVLPADVAIPGTELAGPPGGFGPGGSSSGGFAFVPGGGGGPGPGGSSGGGTSGGGSSGGTPPIGAVPEPGTWMLMILGFGAIGTVMRREARKGRPAVRN